MELRLNAREVFVAPGNTFTLTCTLVNSDGTTASPTCEFYSQTPSVCSVSVSTGVVTAVAKGACQVRAMTPQVSGTDLIIADCSGTCLNSSAHPFSKSSVGRVIHITGGTGFTPGFYETTFWDSSDNNLVSATVVGTDGSTGGVFKTGQSRTAWVFVWPDNILPHFSPGGHLDPGCVRPCEIRVRAFVVLVDRGVYRSRLRSRIRSRYQQFRL